MGLKQVKYLGQQYIHHYQHKDSGVFKYVICPKEDYESLPDRNFKNNKKHPKKSEKDGYIWIGSSDTGKFDTDSTFLEVGQYSVIDYPGEEPYMLMAVDTGTGRLQNNSITQEDLDNMK